MDQNTNDTPDPTLASMLGDVQQHWRNLAAEPDDSETVETLAEYLYVTVEQRPWEALGNAERAAWIRLAAASRRWQAGHRLTRDLQPLMVRHTMTTTRPLEAYDTVQQDRMTGEAVANLSSRLREAAQARGAILSHAHPVAITMVRDRDDPSIMHLTADTQAWVTVTTSG